jgi:hypothetical protein
MSESNRPAFSAPLYAGVRQGAKELAQILPAFPDSVRPVEEPATLGNPTSAIVTQEIGTFRGYGKDAHLEGASDRGVGRDSPAPEIEMGE